MKDLSLKSKLSAIQTKIKVGKTKYNSFGKYHYRNLESIYEALKPLLEEFACYLTIDNDIQLIGDKHFRVSVATLGDCESDDEISVKMFTQEAFNKAGMSPEQASGSTASYSDKYVLNKLLCLDDSQDADSLDNTGNSLATPLGATPAEYVIKFGKHSGKSLKQIDREELISFCTWLGKQKDKGQMQNELLEKARLFLGNK